MKSMTGYARAELEENGSELTVELKAVNHRYLDLNIKLPRIFIAFEDNIRKTLSNNINRGHVDVFVNFTDHNENSKKVVIDLPLARNVMNAVYTLRDEFGLKDDFQLNALAKTSDILSFEVEEINQDQIAELVEKTVKLACDNLNRMRESEGNKLKEVISQKLDIVEQLVGSIAKYAPEVVNEYRDKLSQRITEALGNVELDQARLINEVAFFADKANIDEEIDRLNCHISQTRKLLNDNEPIGRKLDFLIQEFNREANTICSKSNNVSITNYGVQLKNEIEKIREQVQNIE